MNAKTKRAESEKPHIDLLSIWLLKLATVTKGL
jgi:hypothetical protein